MWKGAMMAFIIGLVIGVIAGGIISFWIEAIKESKWGYGKMTYLTSDDDSGAMHGVALENYEDLKTKDYILLTIVKGKEGV